MQKVHPFKESLLEILFNSKNGRRDKEFNLILDAQQNKQTSF